MTILNLLPAIIAAIKAIEAAIPGSGQGKAKLDAVLEIIQTIDSNLTPLIPQITGVVSVLVKLFNSIGVFTKS